MQWKYQTVVYDYIRRFADKALPDVRDLQDCDMYLAKTDSGWSVDIDIPTSASPCWLALQVTETQEGIDIEHELSLRSGSGTDEDSVYIWDVDKQTWQLSQDQEEEQ